jgi:hypothetical protein
MRITKTRTWRTGSQHLNQKREKEDDMNRRTEGRLRGWFSWTVITIAVLAWAWRH